MAECDGPRALIERLRPHSFDHVVTRAPEGADVLELCDLAQRFALILGGTGILVMHMGEGRRKPGYGVHTFQPQKGETPEALCLRLLPVCTDQGDTIFDPFGCDWLSQWCEANERVYVGFAQAPF